MPLLQLTVVVPVYNSAAFLEARMEALVRYLDASGLDYEVVAVDDGSRDASPAILEKLRSARFRVLLQKENTGKFGALAAGVREARGNCCFFTDADVPYELDAIPYMVRLINEGGFHAAIGDRTLPGSRYHTQLSLLRRITTVGFTFFVRLFVTGGLFDTQCGMKAFRLDVARPLFSLLRERGFAGDVELLYIALKYNLAIRRVPARLQYQGESSVRPLRDAWRMIRALARIRGNYRKNLYRSEALERIARQDYWNAAGSAGATP